MVLKALFLGPLKRRPGRFLVTVIGVAVGIASVISTVVSSRAALSSMTAGVDEIAGASRFDISPPGGVPLELIPALLPLTETAVLIPIIERTAVLTELGESVRVLGVDPVVDIEARELDYQQAGEAGWEMFGSLIRGEGLVISGYLAERMGKKPGDTVALNLQSRLITEPVLGTFDLKRFSSAWDRVVIGDIAHIQELISFTGRVDRVEFVLRPGVSADSFLAQAKQVVPTGYELREPGSRREQTERLLRALQFNLVALSGIASIVGAILVATTLATSVVQRRSILALLRSLGASRSRLAAVVVVEAATIGLVGGLLGVAGGYLGAVLSVESVRASMAVVAQGVSSTTVALLPFDVLLGLGLGLVVSLAASILPIVETVETPPLQGLRSEHPEVLQPISRRHALITAAGLWVVAGVLTRTPAWNDLPIAALLSALCLFIALLVLMAPVLDLTAHLGSRRLKQTVAVSVRLGLAALAAGRRRASWAAGAIGVAVALSVSMSTMLHSFRETVIAWTNQTLRSDLYVRPARSETGLPIGRIDPAVVDIAYQLFDKMSVDPFHSLRTTMNGEPITLSAGDFAVVAEHGGVPFRDGRTTGEVLRDAIARDGVVINQPFSYRFGVAEGDSVRFDAPGGVIEKKVVGVFFDYSRSEGLIVADRSDFLEWFPGQPPEGIALFLPDDMDPAAARERFLAALGGKYSVDMMLNRENRQEVMDVFDRTFAITEAMQVTASVVAAIAVLTVLFVLVNERSKDLAVLRAIGGSRFQVAGVVVSEAALLGLIGVAGGLVTGLAVGWVLVKVVNLQSFGWNLQFLVPVMAILKQSVWVIVACIGAGILPAVVTARMTLSEGIRDES